MKRYTIATLLLPFVLAACGSATPDHLAGAPTAQQNTVTPQPAPNAQEQVLPAPKPEQASRPAVSAEAITGTWAYVIHNEAHSYDFEGRVQWTDRSTTDGVTTITGKRFECHGAECKEDGTATLTSDTQGIRITMTATSENCPPYPGEPCEIVTGRWFNGTDADGKIEQRGDAYRLSGRTNVDSKEPEIDVAFEMHSLK